MFKKIGQIIIFFALSSIVAVCQFSFINVLPSIWGQINLVLVVAIFTLFFFDWRSALFYGAISGFWLDLMSFEFFGLYLAAILLTIIISHLILKNLLTNRSFYSFFTLIIAATITYNILLAIFFTNNEQVIGHSVLSYSQSTHLSHVKVIQTPSD